MKINRRTIIQAILIVPLIAGATVIALYIFNIFPLDKIPPGTVSAQTVAAEPTPEPRLGTAEIETIRETYEAVGTVRPRTEARIDAQVTAQVVDVKVGPGDTVTKGQVLVSLDNRQLQSRLDQARQGLKSAGSGKRQAQQAVAAAEAAFEQARSEYRRVQTYHKQQAATQQQLEAARAAYLGAEAELQRAREGLEGTESGIEQAKEVVREAEIALGYTQLKAPEAGEVLRKLVESGDLAVPGKPLIILQTTGYLRLEAYVREGLIREVPVGAILPVEITTLDKTVEATVEEIIPYADPQTRTFLVKATLPETVGLYPGMFGKLLIPVREIQVVSVDRSAVRRVGQLELVRVRDGDGWATRFIKTGKKLGDRVEVLSGLSGGETVALKGAN